MWWWQRGEPEPGAVSFLAEELAEERRDARHLAIRLAVAFAGLFALVSLAFWWSGSALRFGASRVAEKAAPTWRVWGTVYDAATRERLPWARIEDDTAGRPPWYRTEADQNGGFSLLTLAEPHRIRVTAEGYRPAVVRVGRQWFIWWPAGDERMDVFLGRAY